MKVIHAHAKVAAGQSLSGPIDVDAWTPISIQTPTFSPAVTSLTFQAAVKEGEGYADLYDDTGAEVTVTVGDDRFIALDPATFSGMRYLKVRLGSSAAPVAAAADTEVFVGLREI